MPLIPGVNESMLKVIEVKLARLTQGHPTLWIEKIIIIMEEFLVEVSSTWIHLLRRVDRVVLHYREATKAATNDEPEEEV